MRQAPFVAIISILCASTLFAEAPLRLPDHRKPVSMLDRPVGELKLDKVPLSDAIDFLRASTNVNLHVDWHELEAAGVTKDSPVSVHLSNLPLRKALNFVLSGQGTATWFIDQGVIEITTQAVADKHMYTRVYPVDDLIVDVPNFIGPQFSLQNAAQNGSTGGGGQSPFQDNNTNTNTTPEKVKTKSERGQDLVDLITQTIRPDVWKANGGEATIAYYNGMLVVHAPRQVHELISSR